MSAPLIPVKWVDGSNHNGVRLRRGTFQRPPFDCGPNGRNCKHPVKGDHGQHCSEWVYIVGDGEMAVDFEVFAGDYPRRNLPETARGISMGFHAPFTVDHEAIRSGLPAHDCQLIESRKCFSATIEIRGAQELFAPFANTAIEEGTNPWWMHLEATFVVCAIKARKELAELNVKQCATCCGEGLVKKA